MEKFTNKIQIVNYYPRFEDHLFEKDPGGIPKSAKIEDYGTVYTKEGEAIDMKNLKIEMESAKTAIVAQSPLFAPYVHKFTPIYTWLVPTMATDGIRLFVNPKFAKDLSWEQKIFVIIHEIMHCVLLHMERLKGRDPQIFNIAGDLEINPLIVDTISDFDEAFVKALNGVYDEKYLNQPVEAIYKDIAKNMPQLPKPPNNQGSGQGEGQGQGQGQGEGEGEGSGQGQGQDVPISVGDKVKIRSSGQEGVVSEVKPDGTYEVDIANESYYPRFINEGYKREELIPIKEEQPQSGSGGGNVGGANNPNSEVIYRRMAESDPAGTGGVIEKKMGEKIAEESGYDVEGGEAGHDTNVESDWRGESGKLMGDLEAQKSAGGGKGSKLLKTLERLHKGDVNWLSVFRRYVSNALSPEQYYKLGNKKHLGKAYIKRGLKQKSDALRNVVIMLDTSGSMYSNPDTIPRILNEINQIIFSKKIKKIHLAFFDSDVLEDDVKVITPTASRKIVVKEAPVGGGTRFQPALNWIEEKFKGNIALCVFITDGYNSDSDLTRPRYANKFIWLIYDNPGYKNPWGRQINIVPSSQS